MEALSGLSLNDVKVHYNSAQPAQLNALAYARGSEIHLASGQEKHLPHEAWHIVQQKQGRVQPTLQKQAGVPVNNDSGLEQEADAMGAKALLAKPTESQVAAQREADPVIQRKVGFEFESIGNKWMFQGRTSELEKGKKKNWKGIENTKEILYFTSDRGGLGADNKYVEAITKPLSSWDEIEETINALTNFLAKAAKGDYFLNKEANKKASKHTGMDEHKIAPSGPFLAKPQATIGVQAVNIESLFKKLIDIHKPPAAPTGRGARALSRATPALTLEQQIANTILVQGMQDAIDSAKKIIEAIELPQHDPDYTENGPGYKEIFGFLAIILKTLIDADTNIHKSSEQLTDPKYAFPLMPRTDFRSMLATLSEDSQNILKKSWSAKSGPNLRAALTEEGWLKGNVFRKGYLDEKKKKVPGPARNEWIKSIFIPPKKDSGKDKLSPPPGYPAHAETKRPEGLGAYGADEKLLLFELRNIETGRLELDRWIDLARAIAILVGQVENDAGLAPPGALEPAPAPSANTAADVNNNAVSRSGPSSSAPPSLKSEIEVLGSVAKKKLSAKASKVSRRNELPVEELPEESRRKKSVNEKSATPSPKKKRRKHRSKKTGQSAPTRVQPPRGAKENPQYVFK
jgi:hypothetical protein